MSKSCPKCGGRMDQGFMPRAAKDARNERERMGRGHAREELLVRAQDCAARKRLKIETWRCGRCGYLESYAPEA